MGLLGRADPRGAPRAIRERPKVIHVTTTDISLDLLIGRHLAGLDAAGYEVIGCSAPGPHIEALDRMGIRHIPLQHATRSMDPTADVRALAELLGVFRTEAPDVVHTHNPKPGVYGRIAARLARVPMVVNTVHGLYAQPDDRLVRRVAVYSAERIASTCSDAELVQNIEDIATLERLRIPRRKLHLLGNGVDLDRFAPEPSGAVRARLRAELGLADDEVAVLVVGRLVWEKGYREVFEAAARTQQSNPKIRWIVVGPFEEGKADGFTEGDLDKARIHGVTFAGYRSDVEDLYQAADLYVLASYREGFPRSAMEAAACGLPIVATDIRGCRQVVDDGVTGYLVPVRSAIGLADAVERLAGDAALRGQMSTAALAKARAEFDDRAQIELTISIYQRLAARQR